jgi:hypothetical protein
LALGLASAVACSAMCGLLDDHIIDQSITLVNPVGPTNWKMPIQG